MGDMAIKQRLNLLKSLLNLLVAIGLTGIALQTIPTEVLTYDGDLDIWITSTVVFLILRAIAQEMHDVSAVDNVVLSYMQEHIGPGSGVVGEDSTFIYPRLQLSDESREAFLAGLRPSLDKWIKDELRIEEPLA